MNKPDAGSRWWMSATRPATEFSIGIIPRSASPDEIAASASSKVAHGNGCASGYASTMARCELAPGSPWNATFFGLVMAPSSSRSAFCQYPAGGFEIGRGVDAPRYGIDDGDVDPHAGLDGAQLLELFLPFEGRGRQRHKTLQRRAPVSIKANVVIARPLAMRGGRPGKIQRAQPPRAQRRADHLHYVRVVAFLFGVNFCSQR